MSPSSRAMLLIAVAALAALSAISMNMNKRNSRDALLLNPGEASGENKDPDDPWDLEHPRCRGLPTCSDSTSSPIIRDRNHPFRMNALLHAETIDRRAGDTLKRAQSMMMAGMDSAPPGSEDWGHGVGDWNEWLKQWEAYKKTDAYQKARALQAEPEAAAAVPVQPAAAAAIPAVAAAAAAAPIAGPVVVDRRSRPAAYWGLPTYSYQDPDVAAKIAARTQPRALGAAAAAVAAAEGAAPAADLGPAYAAYQRQAPAAAVAPAAPAEAAAAAAMRPAEVWRGEEEAVIPDYVPWYLSSNPDPRFEE